MIEPAATYGSGGIDAGPVEADILDQRYRRLTIFASFAKKAENEEAVDKQALFPQHLDYRADILDLERLVDDVGQHPLGTRLDGQIGDVEACGFEEPCQFLVDELDVQAARVLKCQSQFGDTGKNSLGLVLA